MLTSQSRHPDRARAGGARRAGVEAVAAGAVGHQGREADPGAVPRPAPRPGHPHTHHHGEERRSAAGHAPLIVCPGHGEGDGRGREEGVPHNRRRHTRTEREQRALHEAGAGVRHTRRARTRVARVGGAAAGHVHVRRGAGLRDGRDLFLRPNLHQERS